MFASLIKGLRITKRLTLRQFCQQLGLDPSNWSKVERAVIPPPGDARLLESLAQFFGLSGGEKQRFFDAASLARREIPADLAENELLIKTLLAFFRAVRGHDECQPTHCKVSSLDTLMVAVCTDPNAEERL